MRPHRIALRTKRKPARMRLVVSRATLALGLALLSLLELATPAGAGERRPPPILSIRFTPTGVEFSGKVDSEETAETLARAARSSRPGLATLNRGLTVDPDLALPNLDDLRSLVAELSVSAHEGGFALWEDAVLLSGLTDSRIALTALHVRTTPLLDGRLFINRICIVPSEDLPDHPVLLSTGEVDGPLLDLEHYPTASEAYTPPGLALEKLFPTLLLLADLETLRDGARPAAESLPDLAPPPLRAMPTTTSAIDEGEADASAAMAEASLDGAARDAAAATGLAALLAASAEPQVRFVELGSLRFARNTALLQGNQESVADSILERIREEGHGGRRLLVQALRAREGEVALADYLAERRAEEVVALFVARGIDASLLDVRNDLAPQTEIDEGEVRLVAEIPPPMASDDTATDAVQPSGTQHSAESELKDPDADPAETSGIRP